MILEPQYLTIKTMALIPSESLNFPDSFRANVGWHVPKEAESPSPGPPHPIPAAIDQPKETPKQPQPVSPSEPAKGPPMPVTPEAADSSGTSDEIEEPDDHQLELIPKATEEKVSEAPALSVSGTAAQALIAQLFQMPPATAEPPAESVSPAPTASGDNGNADAGISEQKAALPAVEKVVVPKTETSVAAASPPEKRAEKRAEFSIKNLPSEVGPAATSTAEISRRASEEPLKTAPVDTTKPVVVERPAQANHVLELIAAAVQRGVVVGGPVAESQKAVAPLESTTRTPEAPAQKESPASVSEASEIAGPASPAAAVQRGAVVRGPVAEPKNAVAPLASGTRTSARPAQKELPASVSEAAEIADSAISPVPATQPAAKMPAKIRITPRKLKPRAPMPATEPPPSAPAVPETVAPPPPADYNAPNFPPTSSMLSALHPAPLPGPEAPKAVREPQPPRPPVEPWQGRMPPRKIAAGGYDAGSDSGLFTAQERRNRWIGFGLSEAAALTSLILLTRFAFIHKFPDPTLKLLVGILAFVAAAIAISLPIAFIRNNPTRWQR